MAATSPEQAIVTAAAEVGMPLEDAFRKTADSLRRTADMLVRQLYEAWQAGRLTDAEFTDALASLLATSVGSSMLLGDVIAATYLGKAPHGLAVDADTVARLSKAAATATTLLDGTDDPLPRLVRLGVSEPLNALQQATINGYRGHGVRGYVRITDADPCELCVWLHRDGHVWPTGHPFHQHPGCTCVPVPVRGKGTTL